MRARPDIRARAANVVAAAGALLAVLSPLALSCSYSPDFANDVLSCGDNGACPKGYRCFADDNKCWKDGDRRSFFVGTWNFSGGMLIASCSDAPSLTTPLDGDYMVVSLGTAETDLLAQYFCDTGWTLRLPSGGNTAVAPTGQTCTQQVDFTSGGATITTTYDWSALELTFTTSDGGSATAAGHLTGPFSATDGSQGTCSVTFSGPLTKG